MKFADVTPNLVVADVQASLAFYRDVLGFTLVTTVPDAAPFAFAWMKRDGVDIFLNSLEVTRTHDADLGARPIRGAASVFIVIEADAIANGVDALFASIGSRAPVRMPLTDQFYGMREFSIDDPDGYVIIFAQALRK